MKHPDRVGASAEDLNRRADALHYVKQNLNTRGAYFLAAFAAPPSLARISSSRRMRYSSPSSLISVPPYFPNNTRSPGLTSRGISSPFSRLPAPTAITSP